MASKQQSDDEIVRDILARYDRARADRANWDGHWEDIARRILPQYVATFRNQEQVHNGQRHTEGMIDSTGMAALPKFAAAMESMLTPRTQTWHRLQPMDKALMRNRAARQYYDDLNETLFRYRYVPKANYASNQHEVYMSLGAFGTGSMYVDALDPRWGGPGLRYTAEHIGELYFLTNHQGLIDTSIKRFQFTARQATQKFNKPGDKLPDEIKLAASQAEKAEQKFWFIQCIMPRGDEHGYDPRRVDTKGSSFVAYHISESGRQIVREGGFRVFPRSISRYIVAPGETWGRSPAMMVLPSLKTLNEIKRTMLKQGHRIVDPVLLAHDDGVLDSFNLKPGAVNYGGVSAEGRPLVHALPVGNLDAGKEAVEEERNVVNDGFLVTLFEMLVNTPQMTATEVLERVRARSTLLSPTMGRQQSEAFGPMIERELDVLAQQNLLPPMPTIVKQANAEYHTQYDSPLSRAQRADGVAGFFRLMDQVKEYIAVTQDPSPADRINFDNAMPDLADIQAVPTRWMRSDEEVAAIRQQRAAAQQQQQAIDAAPAAAGVMKALPNISLRGNASAA